jgi:hypothetical protein
MDALIESYINVHFIPEMQNEISRAFSTINEFNYVDQELPFINLLMTEDLSESPDIQGMFIQTLISQQEEVFKAHLLEISEQSNLYERNEILSFLLNVMNLEDYNALETTFSQAVDAEHAFSLACSQYCSLGEHRALELFTKVDPISFNLMKKFVHKKLLMRNSAVPTFTEVGQKIIHTLREYSLFLNTDNLLGVYLLNAGVKLNQPYPVLVKLIADPSLFINSSDEEIAKQFLSLLYLNEQGINQPLQTYQQYISLFLTDLNQISKVQSFVNKYSLDFATYQEAQREKARLLQARH